MTLDEALELKKILDRIKEETSGFPVTDLDFSVWFGCIMVLYHLNKFIDEQKKKLSLLNPWWKRVKNI